MSTGIFRGAAAGLAGTTALNAATYFDMAIRGRGGSDTPQQTVEAIQDRLPVSVPGIGDTRDNRVNGLGSLSGIATGVGVGVAFGLARRIGLRLPVPVGAIVAGVAAMAVTDGSMAALKVADPATWSSTDWLSDLLPHLAYGAVTAAVLNALDR